MLVELLQLTSIKIFHEFYGYKDVYTQILKYLDEEGLL